MNSGIFCTFAFGYDYSYYFIVFVISCAFIDLYFIRFLWYVFIFLNCDLWCVIFICVFFVCEFLYLYDFTLYFVLLYYVSLKIIFVHCSWLFVFLWYCVYLIFLIISDMLHFFMILSFTFKLHIALLWLYNDFYVFLYYYDYMYICISLFVMICCMVQICWLFKIILWLLHFCILYVCIFVFCIVDLANLVLLHLWWCDNIINVVFVAFVDLCMLFCFRLCFP